MTGTKKLALLLVTITPSIYVAFFVSSAVSLIMRAAAAETIELHVAWLLLGHLVMMVWVLALCAAYGVLLYQSATLSQAQKAVWAVVFIVTAPFGMIAFWFLQVWRHTGTEVKP